MYLSGMPQPLVAEPIALVDLDGTLADLDREMNNRLCQLASPAELTEGTWNIDADHIEARRSLIKRQPGFWRGLSRIEAGFEVFHMLGEVGYERHVLTKGPYNTTSAWTEKVEWCRREFPEVAVTITEDKGLVYGRVLFDDWIPYALRWLTWRPRGLVVMLDWPHNRTIREEDGREVPFEHSNVFRYRQGLTGSEHFDQLGQLRVRLEAALNRKAGEYP